MNKRLIWNFLLLPLLLLAAIVIATLLGFLLSLLPHRDSQDAFVGGGYEWYALPIAISLAIIVMVGWTIRIVRDIIAHKKNGKAVILNSLFLLLAYFPVYTFAIKNVILRAGWYYQRRSVTKEVVNYKSIQLEKEYRIRGFLKKEDTTYLFVTDHTNGYSSRKLILKEASPSGQAEIFLSTLHVYFINDNKLSEVSNFRFDTTSSTQQAFLKTSLPEKRYMNSFNKKRRELSLDTSCLGNTPVTLKGFEVTSSGTGYSYLVDSNNNYWFPFSTSDPSVLYVGVSKPGRVHKVYKLSLINGDRNVLTANDIQTISIAGSTVYLFTNKKIIYFEI